jgi:tripartite ATP-independent transporter DctP family solute receptor
MKHRARIHALAAGTLAAAAKTMLLPSIALAQGTEVKERRLRFAMSVGASSPWTQAAQRFAKKVEADSGGRIRVQVFPDGQLSNGNQVAEFELLKNGTVDFTFHSSIILSTIDPRFSLFSIPWIAPSNESLYALIDGPGQQVWRGLDKVGVVPLGGYSTSGFRQITNNRVPITKPADLKGLTIRIPGLKLYQAVFRELGVNPVSTSFGELYGALQQGVVDGQENPVSLIFASKFHEIQKHMTLWNYSADSIGILTNNRLWQDLSAREKQILGDAAAEAASWHRKAAADADRDLLSEMRKRLAVLELTPQQIAVFRDAMQPVYREWEGIVGADLMKSALRN